MLLLLVNCNLLSDTGIQKKLDFGCGFGFLNPKSKLNQNIQKTKSKTKPKNQKNQKPNSKSIKIFGYLKFKIFFLK